ncbi:MAG: helix-turn-helix transcriptional regulator [Lachnospiraceae bacterium]
MFVNYNSLFYSKLETQVEKAYPNGSEHYYLHHFKTKILVMGPNNQFIDAPKDSLYLVPPHVPKHNKGYGTNFTHTLAIFDADTTFMESLSIPYRTPILLDNITEIDELFLNMRYKQMMQHPLSHTSCSICLESILMCIYEQLYSKENRTVYQSRGEALELTRQTVLSSTGHMWTAKSMAARANMSISQYYALYKKTFNITPMDDLYNHRFEKAKLLLKTGYPINYILQSCGFRSPQHFSAFFKRREGISPAEYRKLHKNHEK